MFIRTCMLLAEAKSRTFTLFLSFFRLVSWNQVLKVYWRVQFHIASLTPFVLMEHALVCISLVTGSVYIYNTVASLWLAVPKLQQESTHADFSIQNPHQISNSCHKFGTTIMNQPLHNGPTPLHNGPTPLLNLLY